MTPMTMIPPWNLHHPLPLLTSSKSLHLHMFPLFRIFRNMFPMFRNMFPMFRKMFPMFQNMFQTFPMFLLHNLIQPLAVNVNLDHYLLHGHLRPTLLQPQLEEMPTGTRRLDSPTLFPSQQIILMLLTQSQMLIQGECLLWMKKETNRN